MSTWANISHLNTYAAIKILHTKLGEDGLEDFRTEARTLAHLKHPNIVQVLDFGVDGMTPFLVMQYAPNSTLRQRHPRGIPVPLNIVISYVKQVTAALQYAHNQKFIHRDIKPENMLVGEQIKSCSVTLALLLLQPAPVLRIRLQGLIPGIRQALSRTCHRSRYRVKRFLPAISMPWQSWSTNG